jgi:glycosyltransferase involved in cell wall biosynthesis
MVLSIIIPVFNERDTIREIISKVKTSPLEKEIIVVDDFSTDGTRDFIGNLQDSALKILFHPKNKGKGAAVRTGIAAATGDIIIIQDADLEYDPEDYPLLIEPIVHNRADAVYGSRFRGKHHAFLLWHYIGNRFLTSVTNLLYGAKLTDMETCYKVVKADILKSLSLRSDRFEIEPEITAKLLKKGYRVSEVPIRYSGRNFKEGKKITWKDGFKAVAALIRYRFRD